ncbi:MAG: hypothetical protein U5N86_06490 [Planctomycetota bacterium]|nr:hypothetical protein [Planctomycetota bacterium]
MAANFKILWQRITLMLGIRDEFLCDSCELNYRDLCRRRERPNARVCPDYRKS